MNLNDLVVKKEVISEVLYDKDYNVFVKLKFMNKSEVQSVMNRHTKVEFNKKTHRQEEIINNENLVKDMARNVVKGWKGVTYRFLSTIIVLDTSKIKNLDDEIEFTEENLMFLIDKSYDFGSWLIDAVRDASNFSEKKEAEVKN